VDGNRGRSWALVADGGGVGEKMGSATGIGDGIKGEGGRTGDGNS